MATSFRRFFFASGALVALIGCGGTVNGDTSRALDEVPPVRELDAPTPTDAEPTAVPSPGAMSRPIADGDLGSEPVIVDRPAVRVDPPVVVERAADDESIDVDVTEEVADEVVDEVVESVPIGETIDRGGVPSGVPDDEVEPIDQVWLDLAECESNQRWEYNGSSGYDGGLQFSPSTWRAVDGTDFAEYAWQAAPSEQVTVAERLLEVQGWGAWPHCSSQLGLR